MLFFTSTRVPFLDSRLVFRTCLGRTFFLRTLRTMVPLPVMGPIANVQGEGCGDFCEDS